MTATTEKITLRELSDRLGKGAGISTIRSKWDGSDADSFAQWVKLTSKGKFTALPDVKTLTTTGKISIDYTKFTLEYL